MFRRRLGSFRPPRPAAAHSATPPAAAASSKQPPVAPPPPPASSEVLFYEYTGLKRLRFVRDGLVPISAYFVVKMYLGTQGMFEHIITSARYTAVEIGIFSLILGGHYAYLRRLVHSVTLDGPNQQVSIRTFNILGQPSSKSKVRRYAIHDMQLHTDAKQNILSCVAPPERSGDYFFLERNSRVERLFPKQQEKQ